MTCAPLTPRSLWRHCFPDIGQGGTVEWLTEKDLQKCFAVH